MVKTLSRSTELDIETCIKNAGGNKFNLVLMASARARELAKQHIHDGKTEQFNAPVTALLEFNSGEINVKNYMRKIK
jgi:DNA-directed RNA polymerase subunit K/omega